MNFLILTNFRTLPVAFLLLFPKVIAERYEEAWRLFRDMRTWKLIEPDEVLFTVMIKASAMEKQTEKALGLLDDLRASGLHPTDVT